jgi:DivIVA domain-containing protein
MEDLSASEVRVRTFKVAVRGFDRDEVESYLGHVASYLDALQQQLHQAGVSEVASPHDLAAEYGALGEEVTAVLTEARAAADAMRARAAADAANWRSVAEEESAQALADTTAAILQARESVWETGTEMLEQVVAQCEAMLTEARDSSLRIRSEAERESGRMLTDAQREREELMRAGREEADRTVSSARREADALVTGARHQADVAHERTRALEERRSELMNELESTQKSLLGIEDEPAEVEEADEAPEPKETASARTHWPDDDGAVRIVAARPPVPVEPVDADALAAEVEALRDRQPAPSPAGSGTAPSGNGETAVSSPQGEETPEPEPVSPPLGGSPAEAGEGGSGKPPPAAAEAAATSPQGEETPELEPEPEAEPEAELEAGPMQDPLIGLFHELRAGPTTEMSDNGGAIGESTAAVASVAVVAEAPVAAPESRDLRVETRDSLDPFALRDRLLLPVQNRALRLVKRELVAAQNRALEELRLDPEWMPDADLVDGEVGGVLIDLTDESTAAGFAAAGELLGRSDPPTPEAEVDDPTMEFTGAFVDSVALSLERSRSSGAGKRETASSLSRIFRAWRTDDAERRVRLLSRRAYQAGVLAALPAMDCDRVSIVTLGRSCVDHGEEASPWLITDGPPAGTLIPPASLECSCTIVPEC